MTQKTKEEPKPAPEKKPERSPAMEKFLKLTADLSPEDRRVLAAEYGIRLAEGSHEHSEYGAVCPSCGELGLIFAGSGRPDLSLRVVQIPVIQGSFVSEDPARPNCMRCGKMMMIAFHKFDAQYVVHIESWKKKKADALKQTAAFFKTFRQGQGSLANVDGLGDALAYDRVTSGSSTAADINEASARLGTEGTIDDVRAHIDRLDDAIGFTEQLASSLKRR